MSHRRNATVLAAALLGGCSPLFSDLGEHPLDQVALTKADAFAHIEAVEASQHPTVGDLLQQSKHTWAGTPDPEALLEQMFEQRAELPELVEPMELDVLVFNAGLLNRKYFLGRVEVPQTEARAEVLPERLLSDDWDILLLQEVWEWEDVIKFENAAAEAGYLVFAGTEDVHEQTGVIILAKSDIFGEVGQKVERQYEAQYGLEKWPGPNLKRGFLDWSFQLAGTDKTLHLISTHFTSSVGNWHQRAAQARELGLYLYGLPDEDLVLLGGDFNASPFYPSDTWVNAKGKSIKDWWANTLMYPTLVHYGQVEDAMAIMGGADEIFAYDDLPSWAGEDMLVEPFGDESFCQTSGEDWFSATDCNSLYFQSYASEEFPARLDYLFLRDLNQQMRVVDGALVYQDKEDFGGAGEFELSDHYGVGVRVLVETAVPIE